MSEQKKYIESMEQRLKNWKDDIVKLEKQISQNKTEALHNLEDRLQEIKKKGKDVEQKWEELNKAGHESWEEVKKGFHVTGNELEEAIEKAIEDTATHTQSQS